MRLSYAPWRGCDTGMCSNRTHRGRPLPWVSALSPHEEAHQVVDTPATAAVPGRAPGQVVVQPVRQLLIALDISIGSEHRIPVGAIQVHLGGMDHPGGAHRSEERRV